ncbi:MAG: PIN domain-containing protein [Candidatus Diapherotrites archaeon]|nr:PIN domain-containing protein [Candidatus Diapherotrites archaeon]
MTGEPRLIDSNVLVYAHDAGETEKRPKAREIIQQSVMEDCGYVSTQNMVEFYNAITKKIENPLQPEKARQILNDLNEGFRIVQYGGKTILNAISVQMTYRIHFWDALIVATMEENDIQTIVTENEKDFKKVKWLKVINPFR